MRSPKTFFELQIMQKEHDAKNHSDIHTLPLFGKINHYVLHYAKYAGRLTRKRSDEETIKELKRTLVDAFLITLSASNALNVDLDYEIRKKLGKITEDIRDYIEDSKKITSDQLRIYSRDVLVISNAAMADTMEKRDHFDDKESRLILVESLCKTMVMILFGAHHLDFDIVQACLERRLKIANLKIT